MQGQPKTSFIPKKPMQPIVQGSPSIGNKKARKTTVLSLIAAVIFIATMVSFGGVFFYEVTLQNKIKSQVEDLQKTKEGFNEKFIQEASRLNARIKGADSLLYNHLSPSSLYALLERYTLQTVSFSSFSFSDTKDGNIQIGGTGDAKRYETIVLQSDSFGKSTFMRNVIFDGLQSNLETGNINFKFSATLDPEIVLYKTSLPENFDNNNSEN